MLDVCLLILFIAATAVAVLLWMRWLCLGYTPDYDMEEYLGGPWMRTGFGGSGKACWTEKILRGHWDNMSILVKLTFWRRSLLSFGERYLVIATRSGVDLPDSPKELTRTSAWTPQVSPYGTWQFASVAPSCVVGRAEYRVSVCRIVRTPAQIREALDRVLSQAEGLLQ